MTTYSKAQFIDPRGYTIGGWSKNIDGYLFDWNLGESIVVSTFYSTSNFIISSGLLQASVYGTSYFKYMDSVGVNIAIGPNPVQNNLTIAASQIGVQIETIQVLDQWGKIIIYVVGPFSGLNLKKQISFASVNTGIYFVVLNYIVSNTIKKNKVFKIVKI